MTNFFNNLKSQVVDLVLYNKTATFTVAAISFIVGAILF